MKRYQEGVSVSYYGRFSVHLERYLMHSMRNPNLEGNVFSSEPVFVVGSSRSGTSLVYSILLSSGIFPIYEAETHLLVTCPLKYGDISKTSNYMRFIKDWCNSKQFLRSQLDEPDFRIKAALHRGSYFDFLDFFMGEVASVQGKTVWAENTPNHLSAMADIRKYFPNARFIHVIRDGRAVAASKRELGWVPTHSKNRKKQLLLAAIEWEISVTKGREIGKLLRNYIELRYEDIIHDLPKVLRSISRFTQTHIDEAMVRSCSVGTLGKANTAFRVGNKNRNENEARCLVSEAATRWKMILTDEEKCMLDMVIGDTLSGLGYEQYHFHQSGIVAWRWRITKMICKISILFRVFAKRRLMIGKFLRTGLEL